MMRGRISLHERRHPFSGSARIGQRRHDAAVEPGYWDAPVARCGCCGLELYADEIGTIDPHVICRECVPVATKNENEEDWK